MRKFEIKKDMPVWLRRLGNMGRKNVIYRGKIVSIERHYFRVEFQWSPVCGRAAKFRIEDFVCVPNGRGEIYAIYPTAAECLRDARVQGKLLEAQDALHYATTLDPAKHPVAEMVEQIYEILASAGIAPAWQSLPYYDGAGNEINEEEENTHGEG